MAALATLFSRFADLECGESPLYRALAEAVAVDANLLALAATARHGPAPNLFLAAVHDQLMQGHGKALAAHYATIVGADALPVAGAAAAFKDFVLSDPDALAPTLAGRLVQTNEVRRSGVLYLALAWLQASYEIDAAALIEVGTSAGLLLATARYCIDFGHFQSASELQPEFVIKTSLRGGRPNTGGKPPDFPTRIGLDLFTLNLSDEADRRWLRALIWGDQPERLTRLEAAIEVARRVPMTLLAGDANVRLPGVLNSLTPELPAIIFHSHALNQFPVEARDRFDQTLCRASEERRIFRISMEGSARHSLCTAAFYRSGEVVRRTDLAHYDAHGAWIDWLA